MEEIKTVLSLFDSAKKWNAYIELSNMKQELVNELRNRLLVELRIVAKNNLLESCWDFFANNDYIFIYPKGTSSIGIRIEWKWWDNPAYPWGKRGAFLWVDAQNTNSHDVFNAIISRKDSLPLNNYEENIHNHGWLPFAKKIPSTVFNVDDNITSMEECLYRAKDNATQLAKDLWKEVFKPFANKECADIFCRIIKTL